MGRNEKIEACADWHALAREMYHADRMSALENLSWPAWENATLATKLTYQRRAKRVLEIKRCIVGEGA